MQDRSPDQVVGSLMSPHVRISMSLLQLPKIGRYQCPETRPGQKQKTGGENNVTAPWVRNDSPTFRGCRPVNLKNRRAPVKFPYTLRTVSSLGSLLGMLDNFKASNIRTEQLGNSSYEHLVQTQTHRFFRNLRPGLSLLRNSIPAFSKTATTLASVSVLDPMGPSKLSIRWIVPKATFDFFDNSLWDQPRRARAALT